MFKLMLKQLLLKLKLKKKKNQCPKHQTTRSTIPTLTVREWANLPDDTLAEIIEKLCDIDLPSFSAVCTSWRSAYFEHFCDLPRHVPLGVPILLLNASKSDPNSRKFIRMRGELASDGIFLPEAANKWVCGSSWGWLVLADKNGRDLSLLNPLTRRVIQLPSVSTFTPRSNFFGEMDSPRDDRCYIEKAILSTNPIISEQDCVVIAIVGEIQQLSYCKIGDKSWTNVENSIHALFEVIYHEGTVYAANIYGVLMSFDIRNPNLTNIVATKFVMPSQFGMFKKYLIMLSGRLLLISRTTLEDIKVYALIRKEYKVRKHNSSFIQGPGYLYLQINEVEIWHEWVEIDALGDHLLFVGNNGSFFRPPGMYNSMANCIFFNEDNTGAASADCSGVYDVAEKCISLYNKSVDQDKLYPSFWLTPSPW